MVFLKEISLHVTWHASIFQLLLTYICYLCITVLISEGPTRRGPNCIYWATGWISYTSSGFKLTPHANVAVCICNPVTRNIA